MKGKMKTTILVLAMTMILSLCLAGCFEENTAEAKYWFNDYSKENVAYTDANGGNLDEAGTYWRMTVKKDMDVDIIFSADVDDMFSTMGFTINGKKELRDAPGTFNVVYKGLKLKKGDKLEFHGFWVNGLKAEEKPEGFNISYFQIVYEGRNFIVEDIK